MHVVDVKIVNVPGKPKRRGQRPGSGPATRRRSSSCARAIRSSSSRGRADGCPSVQADLAGPSLHDDLGLRRDHARQAGEEPARARSSATAAATTPAASRRATRAAATSAATASSTSSGARTAFRPRSPRSSTTPTARRASRCCTTSTAHKAYILAPARLEVGATVQSGADADIKVGNCLPLSAIPTGTIVHAVELRPGQGARMVRSAGASAQLVAKEDGRALLRLPSGELRRVPETCRATIGAVSQRDAPEPVERQGRPLALAGQAPVGARHGHEPRRPPARWRRGQEQGQSPGHAVGQAHARPAHP